MALSEVKSESLKLPPTHVESVGVEVEDASHWKWLCRAKRKMNKIVEKSVDKSGEADCSECRENVSRASNAPLTSYIVP